MFRYFIFQVLEDDRPQLGDDRRNEASFGRRRGPGEGKETG